MKYEEKLIRCLKNMIQELENISNDYIEVRSDQHSGLEHKITESSGVVTANPDGLIVGSYCISLDCKDLGSTSGGCRIQLSNNGSATVTVKLHTLTEETILWLFGFKKINGEMRPAETVPDSFFTGKTKFDELVISGPGEGLEVRNWILNDVALVSDFDITLSRFDISRAELVFSAKSWASFVTKDMITESVKEKK